jgi:hypothetical protein
MPVAPVGVPLPHRYRSREAEFMPNGFQFPPHIDNIGTDRDIVLKPEAESSWWVGFGMAPNIPPGDFNVYTEVHHNLHYLTSSSLATSSANSGMQRQTYSAELPDAAYNPYELR